MNNPNPEPGTIPREIWAIVIAAFFIAIGFGLIAPVLPLFAQEFSVSVTATTIVLSAFPLLRLTFAPVAGWSATRLGEKPTYLIGVVIVALSSFTTAFASSYWELLVYRSLGGIGSVMFTVSAMGMIVKYSPPLIRGKVSALYSSMFLIGNVIGPVFGGLLGTWGYRAPFFIYASTLSIAALVVAWMLRGSKVREASRSLPVHTALTMREAMADPVYRASLASGFGNGWTNFGIRNALVPIFIAFAIANESWIAGLVLAAFALGNALVLPFAARFADNVGRKPAVLWGMAINGVLVGTFGLIDNWIVLAVVSIIAGLGAGLMNPAQQAALADVVGSERSAGQTLAVFQMVQDVGAIIGPVLAGLIADQIGFAAAFGLTGLITLLAAVPWLSADEPLRRVRGD